MPKINEPDSILKYTDGTSLELWTSPIWGYSRTIYVDGRGQRTSMWWRTENVARERFKEAVTLAKQASTLATTKDLDTVHQTW